MGTRADFYVGRGARAEWLGSIAWDGYPEGIDHGILTAETEDAFRERVSQFLTREDATLPERDGWPWPWETSYLTDYVYAFDGGVFICNFDRPWQTLAEYDAAEAADLAREAAGEPYVETPKAGHEWPLRGGKPQGEIFGKRSGVIVVSGREIIG